MTDTMTEDQIRDRMEELRLQERACLDERIQLLKRLSTPATGAIFFGCFIGADASPLRIVWALDTIEDAARLANNCDFVCDFVMFDGREVTVRDLAWPYDDAPVWDITDHAPPQLNDPEWKDWQSELEWNSYAA